MLQMDDGFIFPSIVSSFLTSEDHTPAAATQAVGFPCSGSSACAALPQSAVSAADLIPLYGGETASGVPVLAGRLVSLRPSQCRGLYDPPRCRACTA